MRRIALRSLCVAALFVVGCGETEWGTGWGEESSALEERGTGETHPYQSRLMCKRAPGSTLVGVMYDISSGIPVKLTQFSSGGHVGACELAIRASRHGRVCVPRSFGSYTIRDLETGAQSGSYSRLSDCTNATLGEPVLRTEPGYVDFMPPAELAPFRAALPRVDNAVIDAALQSPRTMWYDESALVFVYQDSFGNPKGLRANRVGYDVGSNSSVPDIRALTEYFQLQKFKFPFAVAAGATFEENVYAQYFWLPPVDGNGAVKPVKVWKNRSHWQWVFPVGTIIGEVLYIQAPDDGSWYTFEVRSRVREIDGWQTGVFRPYRSAADLSAVVKAKRPNWQALSDVAALVAHLDSPSSLTPHTMTAPNYQAIFPPIEGAMDYLPEVADTALIKELLSGRVFSDTMGSHWKQSGSLKAFAASTRASFHIVPEEYPAGMFELTENGCRNCHEQTSRPLNNLDPRVVLYGEVWGEDEIFTWHPFAIDTSAFSVADRNRRVNQRLVSAGLVDMSAPESGSGTYRALPKPYSPVYE